MKLAASDDQAIELHSTTLLCLENTFKMGKSTLTPKCKQSFSPRLNDDGFDFKSFIELGPEGIRDVKADTRMLKVWVVE